MDSSQEVASWGILIGALLPILIAILNQPQWTDQQKRFIALGVAFVSGTGTVIVSGNFDPGNWVVTIAAVLGASQAAYTVLWKPTKIAPRIEAATSGGGEGGYIDLTAFRLRKAHRRPSDRGGRRKAA